MYSPCFECLNRYGRQYTEECDNTCEYAIAVNVISNLQNEVKSLQDKVDATIMKSDKFPQANTDILWGKGLEYLEEGSSTTSGMREYP